MVFVLFFAALLVGFVAFTLFAVTFSPVHQAAAGALIVVAAVLFVGAAIIDAIRGATRKILDRLPAR